MEPIDYWKECIATAADECELILTPEQLDCLADAAEGGHENYGMAFYSPLSSDRMDSISREYETKLNDLRDEFERYKTTAGNALAKSLRVQSGVHVSLQEDGRVFATAGRTEQIM